MREGELFGVALEDFDFLRRLSESGVRSRNSETSMCSPCQRTIVNESSRSPTGFVQAVKQHVEKYPPRPYTLPWEKPSGKVHTCNILFRWYSDDQHVKSRSYSETTWKPALAKAGVIPEPVRDLRCQWPSRYATTRREGIHQLRHYYASFAGASRSRSSLNISATVTRPSPFASTLICCRAPTTAPVPLSASVSLA
jgi:hypothetical protein